MMKKLGSFFSLLVWGGLYLHAAESSVSAVPVPADDGSLLFRPDGREVRIVPLADNAVRVLKPGEKGHEMPEWVYVETEKPAYTVEKNQGKECVVLKYLTVEVSEDGIRFLDSDGNLLAAETGCALTPSTVQGEDTYVAEQGFHTGKDEYLYGLGQFQDNYLNVRGLTRRLTQVNTQISIPFVISSKGYGLLWNNYGMTDFNPAADVAVMQRSTGGGTTTTVNVTSTTGGVTEVRQSNVFTAEIEVPSAGEYALMLDVGSRMARRHHLKVDGQTVIEMNNLWLPPTASVIVNLSAGKHRLESELTKEDNPTVCYRKVDDTTVFRSPVSEGIDYTFFAGQADDVIASYRRVTGGCPMMPAWALGYIHCRERFHSQDELLQTACRFRKEDLPVDLMVQDWQYWGKYGWNAMKFDDEFYPSPKAMTDSLHAMDMKFMLSVWSKVDPNSELGKQMAARSYYIKDTQWIDFFNSEAAAFYWGNLRDSLVKPFGIDALWLDATEPENDDLYGRRVDGGKYPGEVFRNIYPLMVNHTVYNGLRRDVGDRRAMILTRCAFTGMQRYGFATWSGDVGNDWETFRRQIVAGLGLSVCGMPWWTYDAGGFFRPGSGQYTDKDYHERFLRWLQTSVYLPLMRVHGYMTDTEFWNYGEEVTRLARRSLELRYSLLPYIYSEAAKVSMAGGTLMRPLVMDFACDTTALALKYQYMFGQSFLVAPVVEPGTSSMEVWLPRTGGGWYDFNGGKYAGNGIRYRTAVSMEDIPVFVKAGSIVPLALQTDGTAGALKSDWEIRIYAGNDGSYRIYEDEGDNYNYERGACSVTGLEWDDSKNRLTIGEQKGCYDGMPEERRIKLVLISGDGKLPAVVSKDLLYRGEKITVEF